MLIQLKNKDTLIVDEFRFKCCIGKNGVNKHKIEGDKSTPKGTFSLGRLYYRADRKKVPNTKLKKKIIKRNMGWCDDPDNKYYNKEIKINKSIKHEKLFLKSRIYDYFLIINYNINKIISNKGSVIFLHLTKNYMPTNGCIAIKEKDFNILLKLINKKTKIKIN